MAAQFAVETVDGSGLARGQLSLAVDSNGTPNIAYATTHDDAGVAFARRDADGWALDTLPAGSSVLDDGGRVCLAMDSLGRAHVGYQDRDTSHLIYAVRAGGWTSEVVPTDGGVVPRGVQHASLQVHPGRIVDAFRDAPHDAFHDRHRSALVHAAKINGKWKGNVRTIEEPELHIASGLWASLAFDSADVARIAYFDDVTPSTRRLELATLVGAGQPLPGGSVDHGAWQQQVIDPAATRGEFASMAGGTNGRDLVAWFDTATGSLKAWVRLPSAVPEPRVEIVAAEVFPVGSSTRSVPSAADKRAGAVSVNGAFRVAYSDGAIKLASRAPSGTWSVETVDAGGVAPSLAYDGSGTGHLAYVSDGALKYAKVTE